MATKKTPEEQREADFDKASREAAREATKAAKDNPDAEALKMSASDKESEPGKGSGKGGDAPMLSERVSQTDQAYLGAKKLDSEEVEGAHNFLATQSVGNTRRENSPMSGNSEPMTAEQIYRENATDIDIRQGVKPKIEHPKEE